MLIFQQSVSKEEKRLQVSYLGCWLIPLLIGLVYCLIRGDDMTAVYSFLGIIALPFLMLHIVVALSCLEWFSIYTDRIEAKTIYGIKNRVYFHEVQFVEEVQINLVAKGMERTFYVFHDGRKSDNEVLGFGKTSCYNKKKYSLRIRKSPALEDYILNTLHFEIRSAKTDID